MTGKERAAFRAEANGLDVLFQYGKGGISDAFIEAVDGALNTRELIKLKVLVETSPDTPREAADKIAERVNAEVIQVIGGVIVLYRFNPQLHKKEVKKPVKKYTKSDRFGETALVKSKKASKMEKQRKVAAVRKQARNKGDI